MASTIIHMIIADKLNEILKRNNEKILLGSIIPDMGKYTGISKKITHFLDNNKIEGFKTIIDYEKNISSDFPNMDKFLKKYHNKLNDDYVLGYYIHLYTDYYWFKYLIPKVLKDGSVIKKNCQSEKIAFSQYLDYLYGDYGKLNNILIKKHKIKTNIFYDKFKDVIDIEEIDNKKIDLFLNEMQILLESSKNGNTSLFTEEMIENFISFAVDNLKKELKELNII